MTWCPQPSVLTLAAALCRPLGNLWCSDCVNPLQSLQLLTLPKPFKSGTQNLKFELGSSEKQCSLVFTHSLDCYHCHHLTSVCQSTSLSCTSSSKVYLIKCTLTMLSVPWSSSSPPIFLLVQILNTCLSQMRSCSSWSLLLSPLKSVQLDSFCSI